MQRVDDWREKNMCWGTIRCFCKYFIIISIFEFTPARRIVGFNSSFPYFFRFEDPQFLISLTWLSNHINFHSNLTPLDFGDQGFIFQGWGCGFCPLTLFSFCRTIIFEFYAQVWVTVSSSRLIRQLSILRGGGHFRALACLSVVALIV